MIILSLFRDRTKRIVNRYIEQVESLTAHYKQIDVVCVENDSKNNNRSWLEAWAKRRESSDNFKVHVIGETTGEQFYPSVVDKERFRILSAAANLGLDYIATELQPEAVRPFMFVESDLIWKAKDVLTLTNTVNNKSGLVAPMVWTQTKVFYDFWAFRALKSKGGDYFPTKNQEWYKAKWEPGVLEVQSVGSMFVVPWGLVGNARLGEEAIVTFTKNVKGKKFIDQGVNVYHP